MSTPIKCAPLVREPVRRRPGRPRKNPLSMEELEEKLEGIRVKQEEQSLEVYIEQFTESLEDLWDPVYEKDLITLFIEGLRTDIRCVMGRRSDRNTVDCLETVYRNAREEDYEIQKLVPYWNHVAKDLHVAQDVQEPIESDEFLSSAEEL